MSESPEGQKLVQEKRLFVITDLSKNGEIVSKSVSSEARAGMLEELVSVQKEGILENFNGYPAGVHHIEAEIPVQVASDIYLHPSWMEAKPGAVIEADRAGNYIVGTKVGGIPSSANPSVDTFTKRVFVSGDTATFTWEDTIDDLVDLAHHQIGESVSVTFSDGTSLSLTDDLSEIRTVLASKEKQSFTLNGVEYTVGKEILFAKESKSLSQLEKELGISAKSLTPAEIEANQYLDAIKEYQLKIKQGEFPEQNMLSETHEYYATLLEE